MRVRAYLSVFAVAVAVAVVLAAYWAIRADYEEEQEAAERALGDWARALATAVDRELEVSFALLRTLAVSPALERGDHRAAYDEAVRLARTQAHWVSLVLHDAEARPVFDVRHPFGAPVSRVATATVSERALWTHAPAVVSVKPGAPDESPHLGIALPVVRENTVRHVLSATLRPAALRTLLEQQRIGRGGTAMIVDRDGVVLATTPDHGGTVGHTARVMAAAPHPGLFEDAFATTVPGAGAVFVAYSRGAHSGLTAVIAVPAVLEAVQHVIWFLSIGAAIVVGVVVVLVVLSARVIARPLAALAGMARAFGRGEPIPPETGSSLHEVQEVHAAFVEAARARATLEEARRHVAQLESVAQLANGAAHEINNPLVVVQGQVELLLATRPDDAELAERGRRVLDAVGRIKGIISAMMHITRLERPDEGPDLPPRLHLR